jgi:hypothetical protein
MVLCAASFQELSCLVERLGCCIRMIIGCNRRKCKLYLRVQHSSSLPMLFFVFTWPMEKLIRGSGCPTSSWFVTKLVGRILASLHVNKYFSLPKEVKDALRKGRSKGVRDSSWLFLIGCVHKHPEQSRPLDSAKTAVPMWSHAGLPPSQRTPDDSRSLHTDGGL